MPRWAGLTIWDCKGLALNRYHFRAADQDTGDETDVVIEADSRNTARRYLSEQGFFEASLVKVEPVGSAVVEAAPPPPAPAASGPPASQPGDVTMATAQIRRSGVTVCPMCAAEKSFRKKVKSEGNALGILIALAFFMTGFLLLIFLWWTIIGAIVGAVMMIVSLFMGGKRRKVMRCKNCGYTYDR
ncbi:MAG: hypothetical protein ACOC3G_05985 [Phycisphaeraceae bacterium]